MHTNLPLILHNRAGEESVVSRGRAFVNSPYWVCTDDCSSQVLHSHSSVLELAQRLYEEKVFFSEHVPKDLTQRPRDDKGHAIRCMLRRLRELELCPTVAPAPNPSLMDDYDDGVSHDNSQNDNSHGGSSSLSSMTTGASASNQQLGSPATLTALHRQQMMARVQRRRLEDAMDDSMNFDYADDMNPQSLEEAMEAEDADSDDGSDVELIEVYGKKASRKYFRDWINTLPPSLHSIYEEETRRLDHREDSPPPLGTLPLKELVRTMHRKEGAIIKYL